MNDAVSVKRAVGTCKLRCDCKASRYIADSSGSFGGKVVMALFLLDKIASLLSASRVVTVGDTQVCLSNKSQQDL